MMNKASKRAFSLTEILVAMCLFALLSTFVVKKVIGLASPTDTQNKRAVQGAVVAVTQAFSRYKTENEVTSSTAWSDIFRYLEYKKLINDGSYSVDDVYGYNTFPCAWWAPCYQLNNGAIIHTTLASFGGTNPRLNAMWIHVDPDGVSCPTTTCIGKSVPLFLYTDGKMLTEGEIYNPTQDGYYSYTPSSSKVPPWFNWN